MQTGRPGKLRDKMPHGSPFLNCRCVNGAGLPVSAAEPASIQAAPRRRCDTATLARGEPGLSRLPMLRGHLPTSPTLFPPLKWMQTGGGLEVASASLRRPAPLSHAEIIFPAMIFALRTRASQRRQCGEDVLRTFVTPGSRAVFSTDDGEGMPQRARASSNASPSCRTMGASRSG